MCAPCAASVGATRTTELRNAMHAKETKAEEKEAKREAAKEAAAKRDAMRFRIRKDRLAAKARHVTDM